MPEKYVRRDGLPMLVRHTGRTTLPQDPPVLGDGPPILCLHDAGLQSSVFDGLLRALEQDAGAIAFDLPGHGRSGSLDALPSIVDMAEVARWVAAACGAADPILVGHGMGALVALEWAKHAGVSGLVLCGAGLALGIDDETISTMAQVTRGKAPRPFDPSRVCKEGGREMMQKAYMEGIKTDPRATLVDLEASRAWSDDFDAATCGIDRPVVVVSGAAEDEACVARAEALASALPGGSTCTLEGAAHFLPLERPDALAALIKTRAEAA
ncbi:MAG: alpha/beta hydrolase [Myxococcota bacterium]